MNIIDYAYLALLALLIGYPLLRLWRGVLKNKLVILLVAMAAALAMPSAKATGNFGPGYESSAPPYPGGQGGPISGFIGSLFGSWAGRYVAQLWL